MSSRAYAYERLRNAVPPRTCSACCGVLIVASLFCRRERKKGAINLFRTTSAQTWALAIVGDAIAFALPLVSYIGEHVLALTVRNGAIFSGVPCSRAYKERRHSYDFPRSAGLLGSCFFLASCYGVQEKIVETPLWFLKSLFPR